MNTLGKNWKTSAVGLCVLLVAAQSSVHFDVAGHLAMTQRDWFGVLIGIAGAITGFVQKDAKE